jgi:hypothetical protein
MKEATCETECYTGDNINVGVNRIRYNVDCINVSQSRNQWLVAGNTEMKFRVPWKAGTFFAKLMTIRFWVRVLPHGEKTAFLFWDTTHLKC